MDLSSPRLVFFQGFSEALQFNRTLKYFASLQSTSISTRQWFVMNGIMFLGSILIFNHGLTPLLDAVGDSLGTDDIEWKACKHQVLAISNKLFNVLWLVPMYLMTFVLNTAWYYDIAQHVYSLEYGRITNIDAMENIRDSTYSICLMAWVTLFSYLVLYVPYIGSWISFAYMSWVFAFYCFNYKLTLQGVEFENRLRYFQSHWLYMLGFGMPCALIVTFSPHFIGYGIYAVIFPICMVLAIISTPVQHISSGVIPRSVRMFVFFEFLNLALVHAMPKPGSKREITS